MEFPTPVTFMVMSLPVAPGADPPMKLPVTVFPPFEFTLEVKPMLIALVNPPLNVCERVAVW